MTQEITIRESGPEDWPALERLYPQAFPQEDLLPLLRALLPDAGVILSLVAVVDSSPASGAPASGSPVAGSLAGHVAFTACQAGEEVGDTAALLGPLAVDPARQRQGIGSALVRAGLQQLETAGLRHVYVLGDPAYYRRFGFAAESDVAPPYPLPDAWRGAWQSLKLGRDTPPLRGRLCVPPPWRRPELWAP